MTTQSDVEKAVARIYCAMLDNVALSEHRKWVQDLVTTGTAAMSMPNSIDEKARHCAIHGCPHCERFLKVSIEKNRARARKLLVLAVLALLVAVYCMGRNSWIP